MGNFYWQRFLGFDLIAKAAHKKYTTRVPSPLIERSTLGMAHFNCKNPFDSN